MTFSTERKFRYGIVRQKIDSLDFLYSCPLHGVDLQHVCQQTCGEGGEMRGDSEDARFDLLEQSGDVLVIEWKLKNKEAFN